MNIALIVLIALIIFVLTFIITGAVAVYLMAFRRKRNKPRDPYFGLDHHPEFAERRRELITGFMNMPCERVKIKSHDGLTLFARYFHVKDGAPLEIQLHGYRSMSVRDFSSSGVECVREGYNLLLVDQRAHGESEGRVISFGINERRDCLRWIEYARERFGDGQKIFLVGLSMGAATVLMASGEDLPDSVVGVIADCPYSSQSEIIASVGKGMRVPAFITKLIAPIGAALFGGFSLLETTPIKAVERARVPILIIHGEEDGLVPCEMSEDMAKKNPKIRLEKFPGADHGLSYLVDTERYRRVVREFIKEAIENNSK